MSDLRTLNQLYDIIAKEYTWRITELSNFRSMILAAKGEAQKGLIRGGVTLLYAHWEGYVKRCADFYYEYVGNQNCKIEELSDCFVSIVLRAEIEKLQGSKKLTIHNEVMKVFFEKKCQNAYFSSTSPIRTSNLKYDIFEDVCILIGIDLVELHERYKQKYDRNIEKTINEELVDKRNNIAHGNYLSIKEKEFRELYNVVVNGLLYTFKELVMDSALNKKYLR
jgi:hypothetical protein